MVLILKDFKVSLITKRKRLRIINEGDRVNNRKETMGKSSAS